MIKDFGGGRMPAEEMKTGRKYVLAASAAAAILLLLNVLVFIWHDIAQQEYYRDLWYGQDRVLYYLVLWMVLAAVFTALMLRMKTTRAIFVSTLVYLAVFILTLVTALSGGERWLRISYLSLYVPSLLYLTLPFTAYAVSRFRRFAPSGLLMIVGMAAVVPFLLSAGFLGCLSAGLILLLVFILLSVRLVRDGRFSAGCIALPVLVLVLVLALPMTVSSVRGLVLRRIGVFLTLGQSDPSGDGWMYSKLIAALGSASLFGSSPAAVTLPDGLSIPAYLFFAEDGFEYLPAVLVLRFGWAALLLPAAASLCLSLCLFRLSRLAKNSFARSLAFSVGALFLVRLVLGLVSCFALFLGGCFLPFTGTRTGVCVDILLLIAALVLSRKQEDLADVLDKEPPANRPRSPITGEPGRKLTLTERLLRLIDPDFEPFDDEDEDLYDLCEDEDEEDAGPRRLSDRTEVRIDEPMLRDFLSRLHARREQDGDDPPAEDAPADGVSAEIAALRERLDRLERAVASPEEKGGSRPSGRGEGKPLPRKAAFILCSPAALPFGELLLRRLEARGAAGLPVGRGVPADGLPKDAGVLILLTAASEGPDPAIFEALPVSALLRAGTSKNALALPVSAKDVLRAAVFRNMLIQVFKNLEGEKRNDV